MIIVLNFSIIFKIWNHVNSFKEKEMIFLKRTKANEIVFSLTLKNKNQFFLLLKLKFVLINDAKLTDQANLLELNVFFSQAGFE